MKKTKIAAYKFANECCIGYLMAQKTNSKMGEGILEEWKIRKKKALKWIKDMEDDGKIKKILEYEFTVIEILAMMGVHVGSYIQFLNNLIEKIGDKKPEEYNNTRGKILWWETRKITDQDILKDIMLVMTRHDAEKCMNRVEARRNPFDIDMKHSGKDDEEWKYIT